MNTYDFLVIGAGFAGLSVASRLAPHGSTAVLEREFQPAYHSSGRSAAMLIEAYEGPEVCALTQATRRFFEGADERFVSILSPRGMFQAALEEAALERIDPEIERWSTQCPWLERVDAGTITDAIGAMDPAQTFGGIWDGQAANIDTGGLIDAYRRATLDAGGEVHCEAEVLGLERRGPGWHVTTRGGEYSAATIINAAGAWASVVGSLAGSRLPALEPRRRTAILVDYPDADYADWPSVTDLSGRFYVKPEAGLLMASPADEIPSPPADAQPDDLDVAQLLDVLGRCTRLAADRPERTWAGLRTFAPDRRHLVGADPDLEDFWWLAGQGGSGVQTSAATAELLASLITGSSPGDWLDDPHVGVAGFTRTLDPARLLA